MSERSHTGFDPKTYMLQDNLTLREYQLKNLEIFKYFDHFCREHGLTYYACGGAVIGAIRHGGFIPWDCDIDVFMPRKDYERLEAVWNRHANTEHYSYDRTTEKYNMHAQCAGIKDNYTTYIRSHNKDVDMNHGIMLDIIPLDALTNNYFGRMMQRINGMIFCLFNAQRLPNQQGKMIRIFSAFLLKIFRTNRIRYKLWKKAEKRFSKYDIKNCNNWCELTTGFYNMKLAFPKEWFGTPKEIRFEDMMMWVPTEPEKYLHERFGDYMTLPSKNEQVPKMDPVYIDINTPYIQSKGIHYCIQGAKL